MKINNHIKCEGEIIGDGFSELFSPKSVAVVGASDDPDRLSGRPIRYLIEGGYKGAIYPVNPNRETVQGLRAWPSVQSITETPAVALIVVPAKGVRDAVIACAERGITGAYLLSGGFAESGNEGAIAQQEIANIARASGMRLLGPNCLGAFNAATRFFGTFASSLENNLPQAGPVAIVSQSGAYGQHLSHLVQRRGIGVQYLITTGNEIDVELAECIGWLVKQNDVRVILAYAEGIRNGTRLLESLEAARRAGKPVVFLKVGSSEAGAHAVVSHTAALAGSEAVHDAALRQFGAWRAASTDEQVDVAYACVRGQPMSGSKVGILSVSGGFGVQTADAAELAGLNVASLQPATQALMDELLPMGGGRNPIDVTGQAVNDIGLLSGSIEIASKSGEYDALVVCLTTTAQAAALKKPISKALEQGTDGYRHAHPVVLLMLAQPTTVSEYEQKGFLVFEDVKRAVCAISALVHFGISFASTRLIMEVPRAAALPSGGLSEVESKLLLSEAGLPILLETLVRSADEAVQAAAQEQGPVAMKIVSRDILHKTEIGCVLLGVYGESAVRDAHALLLARAAGDAPHARIDGVLVSPMVTGGVETILGISRDPVFGPVVMFGLGGVIAECYGDVAFRVAPINADDARSMVDETRAAALLRGWRGAPPADLDALIDALVKLSRFAVAHADTLETVDVNPFLVKASGDGAVAIDAVIWGRTP